MRHFILLIRTLRNYRLLIIPGLLFQLLTSLFTLVSIPLIIPFFQILFGISPSSFDPPENPWNLEEALNYGFSRLIAMSDRHTALMAVCITILVVYFFRNISRFLASFFIVPAINGVVRDLRSSLFESFTKMSYRKRVGLKKGHLLSLISNDLMEVEHGILKALELLFKAPLIILGSIIFMIWLSPQLSALALMLMLFTWGVIGRLSLRLKRSSLDAQENVSDIQAVSDEFIGGLPVIRANQAEKYFTGEFHRLNSEHYRLANRILRKRDLASPLSEFLGVLVIVVMLWSGSQLIFSSSMAPTTFFAFIFAFYNIIDPAKSFAREYYNVQKGLAGLERIQTFMAETEDDHVSQGRIEATYRETLALENVFFHFEEDHGFGLQDICITIKRGQKIGIAGPSGAGKSTLLQILLGYYQVNKGKIYLDGREMSELRTGSYRRLFGIVSQDPVLFHTTIRQNIIFSGEEGDPEDLRRALEISNCEEFIRSKRLGMDTVVGDAGMRLSGGERQRIVIARALYREPDILLLDEPTSSLDAEGTSRVKRAIAKAMEGRTSILVTHDTDLLRDMDKIFVMDRGRIVQEGTFIQLVARKGLFSEILRRPS